MRRKLAAVLAAATVILPLAVLLPGTAQAAPGPVCSRMGTPQPVHHSRVIYSRPGGQVYRWTTWRTTVTNTCNIPVYVTVNVPNRWDPGCRHLSARSGTRMYSTTFHTSVKPIGLTGCSRPF